MSDYSKSRQKPVDKCWLAKGGECFTMLESTNLKNRESLMPVYMTEAKLSEESLTILSNKPSDRKKEVKKVIDAYGGKLIDFYWIFGEYDILTIYDAPDNSVAMAILMTLSAGGNVASHRSTILVPNDQAMKAMKLSGSKPTGYKSLRKEWAGWRDEGGES